MAVSNSELVVVVVALSLKLLAQALSISRLYISGGSWAENAVFRKKWESAVWGRRLPKET